MLDEKQEQTHFLKSLLEANVDGIIAFDRECRYTAWNRAMERLSGVKRETVLGRNAFEVFPCLKDIGEEKYFQEALKGNSIVAENRPYTVVQSGRAGIFDGYYSPRYGENGDVVGGVAIIRDITEQKLAERSAQEAHKRLAFHVENTPLAVIEWDSEFKVLRWSPAAERLFGWTSQEVLGKRFSDWHFVVPEDVEAVHAVAQRQATEQEVHGVSRNRNFNKLGNVVHCEWYNSALYNEAGKLISVLSLVLDVTMATRIEEALRKSEAQYRLLFESNPHAMWVYDLKTLRFLAVNKAAVRHYGYTRPEFLAMTVEDIHPPEDCEELSEHLVVDSLRDQAYHARHKKKTGVIIDVEITSHPLDFGGRRSALVLANDITERKVAEQALLESEDRYRDLVENSHELMCTHDLDGRIISVNPWAAKVLGYKQESLVGMNIRDGLLPEFRHQFDDYIRRVKTEGSARGVMLVRTSSGETRLWEYYNTLRTQGVETPIVRGMAHDATERRKALDREKEARMEAEAANRVKDEFLSTLSHELRTPLTAIMGWSNLLLEGEVAADKQRQAIETIARNANSQCQLIDDLLEVSRIITGKLRLDFAPCTLQPIIQAATESIKPTADAKGVRLECSLPSDMGVVYGDSERLQQVVWNLLSNAVKFTPGGGYVKIELEQINSNAAITVRDSGTGIKPDFLPYVFDRFRQADGSTTRAFGGLGLGLAIVRHLVELHGGSASAQSEGENRGSTFVVKLPLVQSMDHALHPLHPPASRGVIAARTSPAKGLSGIRVLMVDDEFDARELVVTMLEKDGAQVRAVSSAKEALEELGNWKPDVLIADIGMPDEDGYGLIRKVRALTKDEGGQTPALALTAYARTEDRARALSAGYQVHLSKPVDRSELAAVISRLTVAR